MKSFSKTLVRNFIGMIFLVFVVVYFLFNAITNNFISTEAYRELTNSVASIETMANRETPGIFFFRYVPPSIEEAEALLYHIRQLSSLRQLMLNADGIIINERDEVISPSLNQMSEDIAAEIIFLSNYYTDNRAAFENESMVRVSGGNKLYYLMAVEFPIAGDLSFSILLYTDITSAISFLRNINRTLGVLLIISGFVSAATAIILSSKVQKAIARLRKHAEVIGHGNFSEKAEDSDYQEFTALSRSMNNMADMLNAYENNQKQFFQNVSHELRTPLMSIQGYAEGILEDVVNKREASEIILSESERMENLVSQLLFVSRLDSGLDALNITTVSAKNMLYDCAWRMKMLAEKNKKEIVFNFPEGNAEIKTDEEKLQRAVENILTNCIRHANTSIKISYIEKEGGIEIIIEDDGEGFNEVDLPHIFERFYKGANGNSGLGLAICKDIVEKLGGQIKAENIEKPHPPGARFVISVFPCI